MESSRRLAAIMFTDIVGYTELMGKDENRALEILEHNRSIHLPLIETHGGQWLKEMGDGILASFNSSSDALRCARQIILDARHQDIQLRIGIHLGEVVFRNNDVFGDGVNIASRIEGIAVPGSVVFTSNVYDDIRNKPDIQGEFLGEYSLKHVDYPISLYALKAEGLSIPDHHGTGTTKSELKGIQFSWSRIALTLIVVFGLVWVAKQFIDGNRSQKVADQQDKMVTLAALPFSNVSNNEDIDFLGFALVDQVITSLSYLQNIVIRPSSSIRKYSDVEHDPQEVAEALSVSYILTGHYLENKDSVRLNLELIDCMTNTVLWRGSVQESISDIFEFQDIVANSVIEGLEVQFSGEERTRMVKDVSSDPVAYEYYLKSLSIPYSVEGNQIAIGLLKQAAQLDSMYSPIYAELGNRIHFASNYTVMEQRYDQIDLARKYLEQAIDLNSESLPALGYISLIHTELNEMDDALAVARKMIEINPNSALGHFALGYAYRYVGLIEESVAEMEQAVRIDPNDIRFRSIGISYNMAGDYESALKAMYYDDPSGFTHCWKGMTYIRMGQLEQAQVPLRETVNLDTLATLDVWGLAMLRYAEGKLWDDALRARVLEIEASIEDPEAIYLWALVNTMHNDTSGFMRLFEKSIDLGFFPYPAFEIDPLLDPHRDNPEFQRIMRKAKSKYDSFQSRHFDQ